MWLEIVSGKALAAGFALVPAASALPLTFKKRYLAPLSLKIRSTIDSVGNLSGAN